MGFFSSLISGVSDAASFLSNHSDSIVKVVGTIASIAGAVAVKNVDLDDDDTDPLVSIHGGLAANSNYLQKQMDIRFPESFIESAEGVQTLWGDLTGVWPDPSVAPNTGDARQDVVSDVAKYMAINNMPSIYTNSAGHLVDLAANLAGQMMDNSSTVTLADSPSLTWNDFSYQDLTSGVSVKGKHVYYAVPLGMDGNKNAWHSYIRFGYTFSPAAKAAFQAEKKKRKTVLKSDPPTTSYNSTTVKVTWTSGLGTRNIMTQAENTIQGKGYNWTLDGPPVTDHSCLYTYTIYTPLAVAPGAVKQGLSDAILLALPSTSTFSATLTAPPAVPTLTIKNSSTVIVGSPQPTPP